MRSRVCIIKDCHNLIYYINRGRPAGCSDTCKKENRKNTNIKYRQINNDYRRNYNRKYRNGTHLKARRCLVDDCHNLIIGGTVKTCGSVCNNTYQKERFHNAYKKNRKVRLEEQKQWYFKNSESRRNYNKQYRIDNSEYLQKSNKRWRQDNNEILKQKRRQYYVENADEIKERQRQWGKKNLETKRKNNQRRRALELNAYVEDVKLTVLRDMYEDICYLCNQKVIVGDARLRPVHEHIIPLSRGGEHSYANAGLAHASCNSRKQDKLLEGLDWYVGSK